MAIEDGRIAGMPLKSSYDRKRHAARKTEDYVFSQLIPYIGNKRKLLPLIARGINSTGLDTGTFVDLFAGSTVVARFAKTLGFRIVTNDWEPYSYEIARGTVALNRPPEFRALGGIDLLFEQLNNIEPIDGYIAQHLCPRDDEHPDVEHERMFFTRKNGELIDAIREQMVSWEAEDKLSADDRAYLLSSLLYSVSYVSNTSGVFKGFHRGWGGQTGTALYRIRSTLRLTPPITFNNGMENRALRTDAQHLAGNMVDMLELTPDIVYIDPPYNQHPYGSNYHVLNTVALWDKPTLHPTIKVNGHMYDKSAIRKDWRTDRRSPYNHAREALPAFEALINSLDVRWILVSYSTDGNMPLEGLLKTLAARGTVRIFTQKYKRYRVSTPRMSAKPHNIEFLAVLDTMGRPSLGQVAELQHRILEEESEALASPEAPASQLSLF